MEESEGPNAPSCPPSLPPSSTQASARNALAQLHGLRFLRLIGKGRTARVFLAEVVPEDVQGNDTESTATPTPTKAECVPSAIAPLVVPALHGTPTEEKSGHVVGVDAAVVPCVRSTAVSRMVPDPVPAYDDATMLPERVDLGSTLRAVKIIRKARILQEGLHSTIAAERAVLQLARSSPFVARLLECFQTEAAIFFVLPFAAHGDLMTQLQRHKTLPLPDVIVYSAELTSALHFLHDAGFVYRDLSLSNTMLTARGHVLLVDFGTAKFLEFGQFQRTICGAPGETRAGTMQREGGGGGGRRAYLSVSDNQARTLGFVVGMAEASYSTSLAAADQT